MSTRPPLKPPAAAEYLGITERHLRGLMERREIPYHKVGRLNMFDPDVLDAYVKANQVEAQT